MCSHKYKINDIKHIEQDFHSVTMVMLQGWDLGSKIEFRPYVCPLCNLLLNHWNNVAWVMSQVWDLVVRGGQNFIFSKYCHVAYQIEEGDE